MASACVVKSSVSVHSQSTTLSKKSSRSASVSRAIQPTKHCSGFQLKSSYGSSSLSLKQSAITCRTTLSRSLSLTVLAERNNLIDGKAIAKQVRDEIREELTQIKTATGKEAGLAVVLVGSRKDSQSYVRSKKKACAEAGIVSFGTDLPEDATEEEVLKVVRDYNADPNVHGILVQLPLPAHIDEERILNEVSYEKDVDGFHPLNMGYLAQRGRDPLYVACTPKGCIELLERSGVEIAGKTAVVIGRSNIVGMPACLLLQRRDATVTVVHSRTPDAEEVTRRADIVIAACGRTEMVRGSWIKPGAAVIDVGINAVPDESKKSGYRLVGDVNFEEAAEVAGAITPVPGGVGPMTIAMLLKNTLEGFKRTVDYKP